MLNIMTNYYLGDEIVGAYLKKCLFRRSNI